MSPRRTNIPVYGEPQTSSDLEALRRELETTRADLAAARAEASAARAELEALRTSSSARTDELEDMNARLRRLDTEKTTFVASMSHDLRTPLNSIIGFTDLILSDMAGPVTPEQRRYLTLVFKGASQLLALINDILDISRVSSGNLNISIESFSLASLLEECVESARVQAGRKSLTVSYDNVCGPMMVNSDRTLLRRVLDNVLGNAVKFTARGGIEVSCQPGARMVSVIVSDSGIGIASKDLDRVFDAFQQVNPNATEGTGLGLHLCKRLLHILGGEITVQSEPGVGSTFTVRIPTLA